MQSLVFRIKLKFKVDYATWIGYLCRLQAKKYGYGYGTMYGGITKPKKIGYAYDEPLMPKSKLEASNMKINFGYTLMNVQLLIL